MPVILYSTSVSGCRATKKKIESIKTVLNSKNIEFTEIDISKDVEDKNKMRSLCGNEAALPPQLFNEEEYLGLPDIIKPAASSHLIPLQRRRRR
ncbi:domain-binding glutamic acid-rich 3 [Octopus vulgaris]|uniref:Domain-binding glutamic acid-rich 3 n=1 Tax=Octopus vulgaris TaxID=6645 RepID=A0AA36FLP7_OCTVU|nr:domain-binding glutamic acid-rich 3 [Octopus vulgaris]